MTRSPRRRGMPAFLRIPSVAALSGNDREHRRTKASIIYEQTGNLRAVQILLGHTKIESTVGCLGVDIEDTFALAEARRCSI